MPHGISAAVRIASHSSVVRARMPSVSTARHRIDVVGARAMLAKRGSSISSGRPMAASSRRLLRIAEAITLMKPSCRRIWPAMRRQHARIAHAAFRFSNVRPPQMLDQQKGQRGFQHRHVDFLALAGPLAMEQRHADHRGQHLPGQLVHQHRGRVARRTIRPGVQRRQAADPLDQIVERRRSYASCPCESPDALAWISRGLRADNVA